MKAKRDITIIMDNPLAIDQKASGTYWLSLEVISLLRQRPGTHKSSQNIQEFL